jgi:hypothetical protein
LATVRRAAVNMGVQVSLLYFDLHFFGYMPKNGMIHLGCFFFFFVYGVRDGV